MAVWDARNEVKDREIYRGIKGCRRERLARDSLCCRCKDRNRKERPTGRESERRG